ncbi:MAG: hypothetical protein CL840_13610 [Crocinitomicaceae bacterium]|nr:hypothetical protein [Crocinitomicaceae bacterium]
MGLTVYKSSAGSGKTFTLVKEYLKIALKQARGSGIKSILALTFTNKAALEMRKRIVKYLYELCDENLRQESNMYELLLHDKELGYDHTELIDRAKQLLHQLLHQYSLFSVSTIDRFSHGIIRTFSNELGLTNDFEIDLEVEELLRDAIENLIGRAGHDSELTDFLTRFSLDRIENDQSWRIEDEIFNSSRFIAYENADEYLEPLSKLSLTELSQIQKQLRKKVRHFEKTLLELGQQGLDLISANNLQVKDFYFGSTGGLPSYFSKLNKVSYSKLEGARLLKTVEEDVWYTDKAEDSIKTKIDSIKDQLLNIYTQTKGVFETDYPGYVLEKAVLKNFYATALINEVYREFERLKVERNILPISDFNKLIGDIVNDQEAPFIYERIGNHYTNFLIDEFQDTSRLQWKNLMPLAENSLATNQNNLVVGDGKQAIYRWRGGEVEQFVKLPFVRGAADNEILQQRISFIKEFVQEQFLTVNYRSKRNIVQFNNRLFSTIASEKGELIQFIYKGIEQEFLSNNTGGYVEVRVKDESIKDDETFDEFNLKETIQAIYGAREQGYNFGDIAILCRRNPSLIYLADKLAEEGIPIVSSEALLIDKSPGVRLLNTYLKLILDPNDKHEQLRFLFLLKRVRGIDGDPFPLAQSVMKNPSRENLELITSSLGYSISFNFLGNDAYELIEQGIVQLKMNSKSDEYLLAYLNIAHEYFQKNTVSLSGFLVHFEENRRKFSLDLPDGIDAVKLLTIHKAKGLEFPVVIFPFANYMYGFRQSMWLKLDGDIEGLPSFLVNKNKEINSTRFADQAREEDEHVMLDELNILYVVCTRAIDQLHIFTSSGGRKNFSRLFLPTLRNMEGWTTDDTFKLGNKEAVIKKTNSKGLRQENNLPGMFSFPELGRFNYLYPQNEGALNGESPGILGDCVRYTLANIIGIKDIESAIERSVFKFQLDSTTSELLSGKINELISNPTIRSFFEAEDAKTEVEFIGANGTVIRPDRLVTLNGQRIVIEYETGEPSEDHKARLQDYHAIISSVYNEPINAYLVYAENIELIQVV